MKKAFLAMVIMLGLIFLNAQSILAYQADGISIEQGKSNGVPFMTGGVGLNERAVMKNMAGHYNVRLVFATISGAYLTDVKVVIHDGNNRTLIDKESNGPWFFVDLPKGRYSVTAIHSGTKETREAALEKTWDTVVFNWKINASKSK